MSTNIRLMRQLTAAVRDENFKVIVSVLMKKCSSEIVAVVPANGDKRSLGLAVDLGTTSIVVYVVNMADGAVLAAASGHNSQASCGDGCVNGRRFPVHIPVCDTGLYGEFITGGDAQGGAKIVGCDIIRWHGVGDGGIGY